MGITRAHASAAAGIAFALGFVSVFTATANPYSFDLDTLRVLAGAGQLGGYILIELDPDADANVAVNATYRVEVAERVAKFMECDHTLVSRLFRSSGIHEAKHEAFGLQHWFKICDEESDDAPSKTFDTLETYLTNPQIADSSLQFPIKTIEPALVTRRDAVPNDPLFFVQNRHYNLIRLQQAWDITMGSEEVVVQVLDTGLSPEQPDLDINLWRNPGESGANCGNGIDDDNNGFIDDCIGYNHANDLGGLNMTGADEHGAHCAGTIAADTDNGIGVAGVAGGSSEIPGVKIMISVGFGFNNKNGNFPEAIVYGADNGAHIGSHSWSYTAPGFYSQAMKTAIDYWTAERGPLISFAAGNSNDEAEYYPAAFSNVLAVAALSDNLQRAGFSNYGGWIDISAPGVNIYSLRKKEYNQGYGFLSGTSMACPQIAGVLALGLSIFGPNGQVSPGEVLDCAFDTVININSVNPGFQNKLGAGMINAEGVVQCVAQKGGLLTEATPQPTAVSQEFAAAPSDDVVCEYKIVDGNGIDGTDNMNTCPEQPDAGRPDILDADPEEALAGVRCCTLDGSGGDSFCSSNCELVTFAVAQATCQQQSMRLCTEQEVLAGVVAATGCKYDNTYVWTEKQCTGPAQPNPAPTSFPGVDPTVKPTNQPTPNVNVVCSFKMVDGSPANDDASTCSAQPDAGRPDVLDADPGQAVAGTRCCTYDGASGGSFCDGSCHLVTFAEAEARCAAQSMRLCTEAEVLSGLVAATGCQYDFTYVWAQKQCTEISLPTFAPTPRPPPEATTSPIDNIPTTCTFKLVDGGGNVGPDDANICPAMPDTTIPKSFEADPDTATGGVRCCDDFGGGASFCTESCELVTFSEAKRICDENALRLCTENEILNGQVADTGCEYDYTAIWAVEECSCGTLMTDGAVDSDSKRTCSNFPDWGRPNVIVGHEKYSLAATRCCSDDGSGTGYCSHPCELVSYDEAVATCIAHNMRLCTSEELLAGQADPVGCSFDHTFSWSSSRGCGSS